MTTTTAPDPAATRIRRVANSVALATTGEVDAAWLDITASTLIDIAGELHRHAARARYDQGAAR